jgi:hypothetical protein
MYVRLIMFTVVLALMLVLTTVLAQSVTNDLEERRTGTTNSP